MKFVKFKYLKGLYLSFVDRTNMIGE